MDALIPEGTILGENFLQSTEFISLLPIHSIAEQTVTKIDLRVHHHRVAAECSEKQWLAFRGLVRPNRNDSAIFIPRATIKKRKICLDEQ